MEKYRVNKVYHTKGTSHQELDLRGLNKSACAQYKRFCVYRLKPMFRVGTVLKMYNVVDSVASPVKAVSYNIDGKQFVDIQEMPMTEHGLIHFYDDMSKLDALRMQYDVCKVLRGRGIQPTLNSINNLRLMLFDPVSLIKTL